MIGLDTNILLRLWLDDDSAQAQRVDALLADHGTVPDSLLITDVTLVETVWTMKTAYRLDKSAQVHLLRSLLDEPAFTFEDRESVEVATALFQQHACGFSDCLVTAKHAVQGCDFTATFDRGMRRLPGVRLV